MNIQMKQLHSQFQTVLGKLNALSPLQVMERGYSLAYKEDKLIKSVSQIEEQDRLEIKLKDGVLTCEVLEKRGEENDRREKNENMTFEEAMKGLESIVSKLEEGDVPLEQAINYFKKAWLCQKCAMKSCKSRKANGLHFKRRRRTGTFQCSGGRRR